MGQTLVYLEQICDQLRETLHLGEGYNVAALIGEEDPHKVDGWCVVRLQSDGSMKPVDGRRYGTIREMIEPFVTASYIRDAIKVYCHYKGNHKR